MASVSEPLAAAAAVRRVCIAVPTFRRPQQLAALLDALQRQLLRREAALTILVLDNDSEPSARAVVESLRDAARFPLAYEHVSRPGLCTVRNAAIAYARGRFDVLAMIDDDELPEPQWLDELLRIQAETGSDAVIGPVPQLLPSDAPRWIRAGRFFDLPTYGDGAPMRYGYSGNCLLSVDSLERYAMRFDPALNFAGGEDMLFFRELVMLGGRIAFAAKATAVEGVPRARLRASYLLKLYYRRGNTLAYCDRRIAPSRTVLAARALKAAARGAIGLALLVPLTVARGRTGTMIALCDVAQGLGGLTGLGGHIYNAYGRVDPISS